MPGSFGKLDKPRSGALRKLPLPEFIETLYQKRFGKDRPDVVCSIEQRARLLEQKKAGRREKKRLRREGYPPGPDATALSSSPPSMLDLSMALSPCW